MEFFFSAELNPVCYQKVPKKKVPNQNFLLFFEAL
jgi:hypothetical protein